MPFEDHNALLLEAAHTPVGRLLGCLKKFSAANLGVVTAKGTLKDDVPEGVPAVTMNMA